ncbi:hypothetical protein H4F99_06160 [Lysobacter sp. SG-8]|uniref:Uncharacterized protein n=1 Tax=Marilutibacter penaei TaxID=2759900 RepID=A0A7W3U3Q4_9GAMM|nr:hypothetical protein [Lysobacter penaei]MBB1088070.1 hypothetical protein [Lysobacter penaei]
MHESRLTSAQAAARWLRAHALSLWFGGLGVLGIARFAIHAMSSPPAVQGWAWLAGGLLCLAAAWRARPRG